MAARRKARPVPRRERRERELAHEQGVCRPGESPGQAMHVRVDPRERHRDEGEAEVGRCERPLRQRTEAPRQQPPQQRHRHRDDDDGCPRRRPGLVVQAVAAGHESAAQHLPDSGPGERQHGDEPPGGRREGGPPHRPPAEVRTPQTGSTTAYSASDIAASGAGWPGHERHLSRRLVQEHVDSPRQRPAAVLAAALEGGRALAVDDVEQHPGAIGVSGRQGVERQAGRRRHGADDEVGVGPLAEGHDVDGEAGGTRLGQRLGPCPRRAP